MTRIRNRLLQLTLLTILNILGANLWAADVSYSVSFPNPTTGLVHVTMEIRDVAGESLDVAIPMWTPGGYGTSWFSKNIREVKAEDKDGNVLSARQVDTSKWQIRPVPVVVRIHYKVFIPTRRGMSRIDDKQVTLLGPATFMYLVGNSPYPEPGPLTLRIDMPRGWEVATGLEQKRRGVFTAPDYDTFIDAPIMLAHKLDKFSFKDHGARYEIAVLNSHNYDHDDFSNEVKHIVSELAEMMGGVPFERYVFLLTGLNRRGGGLEHLNSTSISFKRYDETSSSDYHRLQFLIAHEFFHLWNVKRIRPEILGPFDYSRPQHTRNLYVSEGMTDYYGYMAVARAGLWSNKELYKELAKVIEKLQTNDGRLITSVELASFRAWTRSDNPEHTEISYYTKGSLIGLLLDLEIRSRTENRKNLDDVFRRLMAEHGLPLPGFKEDGGFQGVVEDITAEGGGNTDFSEFFTDYVAGVKELDYNAYLKYVGLKLKITRKDPRPAMGLKTKTDADRLIISGREYDGAAYNSGLMKNDILLTLNDERVVPSTINSKLKSMAVGDKVELIVMRGDRMVEVPLILEEHHKTTYEIIEDPEATTEQVSIRESWLKPYAEPMPKSEDSKD